MRLTLAAPLLILALPAPAASQLLKDPSTPRLMTALPAPAGLAAALYGRWVTLQWQAVPGATGYRVFRKLASEAGFQELAGGTTVTVFTDTSDLPPGQHQYYVQAGNGLPSAPVTISLSPLPAPLALNVMTGWYNRVDLSWQLPFDLKLAPRGYLVFRQRQGEPGFTQITATAIPALSYQDNGVLPGQRVNYYVQGVYGNPSPPVSIVVAEVKVPQIVGSCGSGSLTFRYSAPGGATRVNVMRAGTPSGPWYVSTVYFVDLNTEVIRTTTNMPGVLQYYKLQVIFPIGVSESVVIPLTIPAQRNKDPLIDKFFATPVPGVSVEWQCPP